MTWTTTHTYSVGEVLTAANMNLMQDNLNASNPVGDLKYIIVGSAGNAVENVLNGGWLECNAAQVSRSTYGVLNAYLAALTPTYPFGTGNGTTTLTLPDLQGKVPVHLAPGGHADVNGLGDNDGTALASRRMKHNHTMKLTGHISPPAGSAPANPSQAGEIGGSSAASGSFTNATEPYLAVGPQTGAEPLDTIPYLVAGIWVVKF
jgi:microcystin-dependent protein